MGASWATDSGAVLMSQCIKQIWDSSIAFGHDRRCLRKAVRDGYCRQHHPDSEAERKRERAAKWKRDQRARELPFNALKAIREIAAGHDDPRALALEVLNGED